ncbi:PREDICTED: neogenin-like [Priapulus caudatus]|uniref:Neogenin-like n=1 Tax=Priapulus caudatus TaxID=37621 RepID=A0ABM1EQ94_PRICU|nr:PREDICTED: neogenin-like [Priapulus caudatus]
MAHVGHRGSQFHVVVSHSDKLQQVRMNCRGCSGCILTILVTVIGTAMSELVFLEEPQSGAVSLGNSHTLDCVSIDRLTNQHATVEWLHNRQLLLPSINHRLFLFPNGSLNIINILESDLGGYTCIASHSNDTISSQTAILQQTFTEPFMISPVSQDVLEGASISLFCVTGKSDPLPEVYWTMNGRHLSSNVQQQQVAVFGDRSSSQRSMVLEFNSVMPSHAGSYRCAAKNPLTRATVFSGSARLNITVGNKEPYVIQHPKNIVIHGPIGSPFAINCVMGGRPKPEISWLKNGKVLEDNTHIWKLNDGYLYFDRVVEEDEGIYTCRGNNSEGMAETSTQLITAKLVLHFQQVPRNKTGLAGNPIVSVNNFKLVLHFQQVPRNKTGLAGNPITFTCRPPYSFPNPAKIVWYKENQVVMNRTGLFAITAYATGDLHISNVQKQHEGRYFCVAINEFAVPQSRSTPPVYLTVKAGPLLIDPPLDVTIVKGETLHLPCRVTGDPELQVHWFHDGKVVMDSRKVSFGSGNQQLYISDVSFLDEGHYYCIANNSLGSITSPTSFVDVLIPPYFVRYLKDQYVEAGSSAKLSCLAYGDPPPDVTWYNETGDINSTSRIQILDDGLHLTEVYSYDEGEYTCHAENIAGLKQMTAMLYIQEVPEVRIEPSFIVANISSSLMIYCNATGVPAPTRNWIYKGLDGKKNEELPSGVLLTINNTFLSISKLELSHAGTYSCIATNIVGRGEFPVLLTVESPPVITALSDSLLMRVGASSKLTCQASGTPAPDIAWFHGTSRVSADNEGRMTLTSTISQGVLSNTATVLSIKLARWGNRGNYTCRARNPAGEATRSVTLDVNEVPVAPVLQSAFPVSSTQVKLTWFRKAQDNYAVYYTLQYKDRSSVAYSNFINVSPGTTEDVVEGLVPATMYMFRIGGGDELGPGPPSNILTAKTFQAGAKAPRSFQVLGVSAQSVTLSWELPEQTSRPINFYRLLYKKANDKVFSGQEIESDGRPRQVFNLTGLAPFTTYIIKVQAALIENHYKLWGNTSDMVDVHTMPAAPSSPPSNITVEVLSSNVLNVKWSEIPHGDHNGPIKGYVVAYKSMANLYELQQELSTDEMELNITELRPWGHYSVVVQGFNDAGRGVTSPPVIVKTYPEPPSGPPQRVSAEVFNSSAINVAWLPVAPPLRNSEIHGYVVEYISRSTGDTGRLYISSDAPPNSGTDQQFSAVIGSLHPWAPYRIQVAAYTNQVPNGFGPFSVPLAIWTHESLPGHISNLVVISPAPETLHLSWDPPLRKNGRLVGYVLYVIGRNGSVVDNQMTIVENLQVGDVASTKGSGRVTNYSTAEGSRTMMNSGISSNRQTRHDPAVQLGLGANRKSRSARTLLPSNYVTGTLPAEIDYKTLKNKTEPVFTNDTSLTIVHMNADLSYSISVMAVNSIGVGSPVNATGITVQRQLTTVTEANVFTVTSMERNETNTMKNHTQPTVVSTEVEANQTLPSGPVTEQWLSIIIGASVSGTMVIVFVLGLCLRSYCYHDSRKQTHLKAKRHPKDTVWPNIVRISNNKHIQDRMSHAPVYGAGPRQDDAHLRKFLEMQGKAVDVPMRNVATQTAPKPKYQQSIMPPSDPVYDYTDASPVELRRAVGRAKLKHVQPPDHIRTAMTPEKRISPADVADIPSSYIDSSSSESSPSPVSWFNVDASNTMSAANVMHRNRMQKESADAIAKRRIRATTPVDFALPVRDKQDLLQNDAVVVLDERTAL